MTLLDAMSRPPPASMHPMTMGTGLRSAMARAPEKIALRSENASVTYRQLVSRVERVTAATIALGLKPGQSAAIVARNSIQYLEVVIGAPDAGLAVATINPKMTAAEVKTACDDAGALVVFCDEQTAPIIRQAQFARPTQIIEFGAEYEAWLAAAPTEVVKPVIHEWDVWTIPYTSGTTGKPKGVALSHRSRVLVGFQSAVAFGCFGPDDTFLAMTPMNHGGGLAFPVAVLLAGGCAEIMDRFDAAEVLRKLKFGGITGVFMVPTHFSMIFALPADLLEECRSPPLKAIIANAAPLPQAMKVQIVRYFGDGVLNEIYSSTEMGLVSYLGPAHQLIKQSCVGQPFSHVQIKLLNERGEDCGVNEVGEIFSWSPGLFNGYWNQTKETEAAFKDGWLSVGDMGRRDEDGFLYIVDRKKDMVISGGVNIYPREIEEVLIHHPSVAEVAVVGAPDEKWGERLKAFIVAAPGEETFEVSELVEFCQGKLASYKIPRDFTLIQSLPRNSNGKILKRELRES